MSEQLLEKLIPKLRRLDQGAYGRAYKGGRTLAKTSVHQLLRDLLTSLDIEFKEDVAVPRTGLSADFKVKGTLVFVDPRFTAVQRNELRRTKARLVIIRRDSFRSDRADHGFRVLGLGDEGKLQTIFLDDPSFNFDYAHILPRTEKCSVMHGHTSSVLVEVIGHPVDGMVVDFAVAKQIVKEAVRSLDHKLFIHDRYVTSVDRDSVSLRFETVHGRFAIKAPKQTTVLMDGEATVENLAKEVLERVTPRMPENVTAVGVYVYEGLNKGSHILARLHQEGAPGRRRAR